MPSTFDPLLRLELQATGENATTWGIKTNTNLDLLAESIAGAVTLNVAGSGDFTLSTANGAADEARQAILILTGLLTGNRNIIVPSSPKNYTVINQTTGAFTVTLKQSAGTGLPIPTGGPTITVCTSTTCVDSIGATPYSKTLLAATSAQVAVSALGLANTATIVATSVGSALITAVDTSAARTAIDAVGTGALTTSGLTMSTGRLLGRTTASSGAVEEISVGSGLTLSAGSLVASPSGLLLNTQVFTSSGTYTRTSGATRAVVIAVGGGGGGRGVTGNGGTGGTTSFGSHVTAIGGSGGAITIGGAGGTGGSGATIAIPGQGGTGQGIGCSGTGGGQGGGRATTDTAGVAGSRGGGGSGHHIPPDAEGFGASSGAGGGQGETGIKYITSGLGATETVTIGAGGTAGAGTRLGGAGGAGYIIVYEYS